MELVYIKFVEKWSDGGFILVDFGEIMEKEE